MKPSNPLNTAAKPTASSNSRSANQSASSSATTGTHSSASKRKGPLLRRGKWSLEEEQYANRLIQEFKAGLLPLTDGTTLRTFLSKLLNCDPMRYVLDSFMVTHGYDHFYSNDKYFFAFILISQYI